MNRFTFRQLLLAVFLLVLAVPAHALPSLSSSDAALYRQAFAALKDKRGQEALSIASGASDRSLYDVVAGLSLGAEDSNADFSVYENYLNSHISWPKAEKKKITFMAERRMTQTVPTQNVLNFFAQNEVQTLNGLRFYVAALYATNQQQQAASTIRKVWRETVLDSDDQNVFPENFRQFINADDTRARGNMLVWGKKYTLAEELLTHMDAGSRAAMVARLAFARGREDAPRLLNAVPRELQNDPGLLYERMRYRRKKDDFEGALEMMQRAQRDLGHPKEWWDERHALARKLVENRQYLRAYHLAAGHGMDKGNLYAEAEFYAGYVAYRYLNNPQLALKHFTQLYQNGETPITLARGGYWLARVNETLGQSAQATQWYQRAAQYGTCFYGQLAAARVYPAMRVSSYAPPIADQYRASFEANPNYNIIALLIQGGGHDVAESFALAWAADLKQEYEFRQLAQMALDLNDADLAVKVAKAAAKKKILLPVEGYPVLAIAEEQDKPWLVHAITRQESQFDPVVVSPSNAQGLMQLLPSTARDIAGKAGVDSDPNLFDPDTNVKLGAYYINHMVDRFEGSLPIAIAAYNAGPGRLRQWIEKYGDPRAGRMDMIDWIENIPVDETRNYVHRVIEAMQIYRAKFSGGNAPLEIERDLQ